MSKTCNCAYCRRQEIVFAEAQAANDREVFRILNGDGSEPQKLGVLSTKQLDTFKRERLNTPMEPRLPAREDIRRCLDSGERPHELARELGIKVGRLFEYLREPE